MGPEEFESPWLGADSGDHPNVAILGEAGSTSGPLGLKLNNCILLSGSPPFGFDPVSRSPPRWALLLVAAVSCTDARQSVPNRDDSADNLCFTGWAPVPHTQMLVQFLVYPATFLLFFRANDISLEPQW